MPRVAPAFVIARVLVRVLPAPPPSPAQLRFPAAVEIVFNFPRLCGRIRGIARSLPAAIDQCGQKCGPSLWPRRTFSRRNSRSRTETGSLLRQALGSTGGSGRYRRDGWPGRSGIASGFGPSRWSGRSRRVCSPRRLPLGFTALRDGDVLSSPRGRVRARVREGRYRESLPLGAAEALRVGQPRQRRAPR
jgi:hypothetical protein